MECLALGGPLSDKWAGIGAKGACQSKRLSALPINSRMFPTGFSPFALI
ncbi:hypothetical protein Tco_0515999, partial [Tanacetum coccineum]